MLATASHSVWFLKTSTHLFSWQERGNSSFVYLFALLRATPSCKAFSEAVQRFKNEEHERWPGGGTPLPRLLHDLQCVAACPAACWFRRGYLNRGPKSCLICHSAAWENWATPQCGYLIISFVLFCSRQPRGDTNILFGEGAGERRAEGKKRERSLEGTWGDGGECGQRPRAVCNNSCFPPYDHIFCPREKCIRRQKSSESRHACRNLRAAVGRPKMGPIRSLKLLRRAYLSWGRRAERREIYIEENFCQARFLFSLKLNLFCSCSLSMKKFCGISVR